MSALQPPHLDARLVTLQGSLSHRNTQLPQFSAQEKIVFAVLQQEVEEEELILIPHVGKSSPLGVKLQSNGIITGSTICWPTSAEGVSIFNDISNIHADAF